MDKTTAIYTALAILLAAFCLMQTAQADTTSTFTVTASASQYTIDLPAGTIFNSTITTTSTIRVWASDFNGSLVANLGLVDDSGHLDFVATKGGTYTISFENNVAQTAQVTFSYKTDPQLSSDNPILPITYLPIFIIITVIGCILIIYISRRKRKDDPEQS